MTADSQSDSYRILSQQEHYRGYVSVSTLDFQARMPDGTMSPPTTNTAVVVKNGVIVIPYDPKEDKVLLTSEFRIAMLMQDGVEWDHISPHERPSGRLLGCVLGAFQKNELFDDAAYREGREESGDDEIQRAIKGPKFPIAGSIMPNFLATYIVEFDSTKEKGDTKAGLVAEG